MVSVCTVPARGARSCEHFGGYKAINRIPFMYIFHSLTFLMDPLGNLYTMPFHIPLSISRMKTVFYYMND